MEEKDGGGPRGAQDAPRCPKKGGGASCLPLPRGAPPGGGGAAVAPREGGSSGPTPQKKAGVDPSPTSRQKGGEGGGVPQIAGFHEDG
ncbi:MAG: hypothetical protein CO137_02995 [Candidatus Magasanikbacteria bacterium CG_4_9_14_3_um_filter_32_9]|uniref:Uncharacterized protein n=1 Tax=Candidatus Magasanikbacteria bacterium CG_4_9_14_3_um_filter_32_9 TaxID=1974644 RepID=A0A2M7Z6D4_9BACT|nr:MAG: hypothetical protein CO137_02995 [Candidatus Magasanikbacteria bacterium CG_4_9_14_3_um_filter_32_9]